MEFSMMRSPFDTPVLVVFRTEESAHSNVGFTTITSLFLLSLKVSLVCVRYLKMLAHVGIAQKKMPAFSQCLYMQLAESLLHDSDIKPRPSPSNLSSTFIGIIPIITDGSMGSIVPNPSPHLGVNDNHV